MSATRPEAHFAAKKELMLAFDCPDREAQIEKHEHLQRSIEEIGFALTSDQSFWAPASALYARKQRFVPHLTYSDRHLADFIVARRVAQETILTVHPVDLLPRLTANPTAPLALSSDCATASTVQ